MNGGLAIMYELHTVHQAHSPLLVKSCLILTTTPWSGYDYPHSTEEGTKAYMGASQVALYLPL